MQFAFLGISYQNTELEVREKAAFTDQKKMDFFTRRNRRESGSV